MIRQLQLKEEQYEQDNKALKFEVEKGNQTLSQFKADLVEKSSLVSTLQTENDKKKGKIDQLNKQLTEKLDDKEEL